MPATVKYQPTGCPDNFERPIFIMRNSCSATAKSKRGRINRAVAARCWGVDQKRKEGGVLALFGESCGNPAAC